MIEGLATHTHPIVRRHNRLVDIFGDAPISWFDDREELLAQCEAALAMPQAELDAACNEAAPWVLANFPSQAQWVEQTEAIIRQTVAEKRAEG